MKNFIVILSALMILCSSAVFAKDNVVKVTTVKKSKKVKKAVKPKTVKAITVSDNTKK